MGFKYNNNFFYQTIRIIKKYREYIDLVLGDFGLDSVELDIMTFLVNNQPIFNTSKDIRQYRGISKALVSKNVNSLIEKGYLRAEADPSDRRRTLLYVTHESQDLIEALKLANESFKDMIIRDIDRDDLEIYSRVNRQMIENLR